jgi:hypothetical protein
MGNEHKDFISPIPISYYTIVLAALLKRRFSIRVAASRNFILRRLYLLRHTW